MAQEKLTLSQRYEMAQSELQQLGTIIARIDERVTIFMKKHDVLDGKLADHIEFGPAKKQLMELAQKMAALEAKTGGTFKADIDKSIDDIGDEVSSVYEDIEKIKEKQRQLELTLQELRLNATSHESRWKWVGQIVFQGTMSLLWVIIAILLYHFGIPAPPTKP